MTSKVKIDQFIQEIKENVEGLEACFLMKRQGQILFQRVLNNAKNSFEITSLLIKTMASSHIVTQFSIIKFVTLEGKDIKIILSYLPHQDCYIAIVGSKVMMSGIVQIYLNKAAQILD